MKITVFGGSSPKPGEEAYQQAYQLGCLIGEAGYTVLTGGYIGTMEAVSRGANENGGYVIGVTCGQIETWRPVSPNRWVQEEMRFDTLRDRMYALIDNCDAALVLPGGGGMTSPRKISCPSLDRSIRSGSVRLLTGITIPRSVPCGRSGNRNSVPSVGSIHVRG